MSKHTDLDYDKFWRRTKLRSPQSSAMWPIMQPYAKPGAVALEIGPGTRPRLPISGTHFLETSASAVAQLSRRGGQAVLGDAEGVLPFASETFDVVAAFHVLEHLKNDKGLVREIVRVLKPGGVFIFGVPVWDTYWTIWDNFVGHRRRYNPDSLRELFADTSFVAKDLYACAGLYASLGKPFVADIVANISVFFMRFAPSALVSAFETGIYTPLNSLSFWHGAKPFGNNISLLPEDTNELVAVVQKR